MMGGGIRIRQDGGFFFAENDTLRLVGIGTSPKEALADYCTHQAHFQQYYTRLPTSAVIGEGRRLKRLFQNCREASSRRR